MSFEDITNYIAAERVLLLCIMYGTWFLMPDLKEQLNCVKVFPNYNNNNNNNNNNKCVGRVAQSV